MIDRPYDVRDDLHTLAARLDDYAARLAQLFGSQNVGADTRELADVIRLAAKEIGLWRQATAAALNERDTLQEEVAAARTDLMATSRELALTSRQLGVVTSQLATVETMCDQFWKHLATPVGDDHELDAALEAYQQMRDSDYRPA